MRISVTAGIAGMALVASMLLNGCQSSPSASWAPAPVTTDGLVTLASSTSSGDQSELVLRTQGGPVTFWGGVNVGSTTPGHNPGELSVPAETFRRWFGQMSEMGIRFVRNYTIMPPYFYDEFARYNTEHADEPLYLIQGVYLPDETYYIDSGDLYAARPSEEFTLELRDASAAVSGDLQREQMPGRAYGTWTTDISPWLAGWIIGAELDPKGLADSDVRNASAPEYTGTYFRSVATETPTTPTERWLAARMDELATAEAGRGRSEPIAFVNWPTTDPLAHPVEPNPREDLVSLDANHVLPTPAWPGGSFASYHAYPYYPDFMRFEPGLQKPGSDGLVDSYLGYVTQLREHHSKAGLPTVITEFGVPASIGAAHYGTNGRDQGAHDEATAMAMDAQMLRGIKESGLSGALLFIWADEWFKFTWNTAPRFLVTDSERRALWHDPLTNEQWFGVIAQDPTPTGWRTPVESEDGQVRAVSLDTDASFAHLRLTFADPPTDRFALGFDIVDGGQALPGSTEPNPTSDVAVVVDPSAGTAKAYIRDTLDPIQLDGLSSDSLPPSDLPGWSLQRLSADRAVPSTGGLPARAAEFFEIGNLVRGTWDPKAEDANSMATWSLDERTFDLRLPWSMLMLGDPSSKVAVVPVDGSPTAVPVETIAISLDTGNGPQALTDLTWDAWNQAPATERVKRGAERLADAWRDVSARAN